MSADLARRAAATVRPPAAPIAYFCAEYGFHALAPDLLRRPRRARRRHPQGGLRPRAPLVAVGLLYRQGYFRQRIDAGGWQHEYWVDTDPDRLPAALVTGDDGDAAHDHRPGRRLRSRRADLARRRRPRPALPARRRAARERADRALDHLAPVHRRPRGAPRAVRAARHRRRARARGARHRARDRAPQRGPRRVRRARARHSRSAAAWTPTRRSRPRAAGRSSPPTRRSRPATTPTRPTRSARRCGRSPGSSASTPRSSSASAARTPTTTPSRSASPSSRCARSRAANGVSRRHGEVAREMWQRPVARPRRRRRADHPRHQRRPRPDLARRADARAARPPPRRGLAGPRRRPGDLGAVDDIPDAELWAVREQQRAELIDYVRDRAVVDRLGRDEPRSYAEAAADALDPDVLTIGFARRLATYKRLHLLLQDVDRATACCPATGRSSSCSPARRTRATTRASASSSTCSSARTTRARPRTSPTSTTTTSRAPRASCAAATSGSTSRARRWRRAGRAA